MRKFHRHGHYRMNSFGSLNGAIWLIGLGILFLTGHWWPGILVLVGLSIILSSLGRVETPPPMPLFRGPEAGPAVPPPSPAPVVIIQPAPAPAPAPTRRADLLPATCLHCGGPIRANEVKWNGPQSAACPYCGSTLQMKSGK